MSGQSWIEATAEQRAELRGLAGSSEREEADRARAILLSLDGWTSERIAAAFCAQPDSVRHWRWIFGREGVEGLRARKASGPEPIKARAALAVIEDLLAPGQTKRPDVQGREITPPNKQRGQCLPRLGCAEPHQPISCPPSKRVDQTDGRRGVDVRPLILILDAKASVRC